MSYVHDILQRISDEIEGERDPLIRAQRTREFREAVPTLGQRLLGSSAYALRVAGVSSHESGEHLGVSRALVMHHIHVHCERTRTPLPPTVINPYRLEGDVVTVPGAKG